MEILMKVLKKMNKTKLITIMISKKIESQISLKRNAGSIMNKTKTTLILRTIKIKQTIRKIKRPLRKKI